jgi:hypothetical protein
MILYKLPHEESLYELFGTEISVATYDMRGSLLTDGGSEIGVFRRFTTTGKAKWARCLLSATKPSKHPMTNPTPTELEAAYEKGVTAGFNEAIYEVKRGEIDPQTYKLR